ncbi:MAG: ABC transporter ATP-binding protein [Clostridiales bacterium]|jgi:NitT/TauT family transport system ATP-binding protein|nr:ABC transporter ATP-binding protein [Clostridiales bacterium]
MIKKIIEARNISKVYYSLKNENIAIEDISFDVYDKEFLTIVGPSGCGKSTLLSILAGLIQASSGEVFINGELVQGFNSLVGYMLQSDHLLEWRTVKNNVLLGLEIRRLLNKENEDYALELLNKYGLYKFLNYYPHQLSGGMKQKVALIRSLALKPEILFLDEPFSALDFQARTTISDEIKYIIKKENKTVILITHDLNEAICLSDRVVVISNKPGKIKNILKLEVSGENSIQKRKDKNFSSYLEILWKEVDGN